jgi:molybdate transport system substrate-binding protein
MQPEAPNQTLTVYAAASLTDAFTELATQFEAQNVNVQVLFNFAGSQQLAQQLCQGAPADVFASANELQMNVAVMHERVLKDEIQTFARNELIIIYSAGNPGKLKSPQDLAKPGVTLALADSAVPIGNYTLGFLEKTNQSRSYPPDYMQSVLNNTITFEPTVNGVLGKISLGEVDGAVVYTSDLVRLDINEVGHISIPQEFNTRAIYPIAPIEDSANPDLSRKFIDFVLSEQGQTILVNYGFLPK